MTLFRSRSAVIPVLASSPSWNVLPARAPDGRWQIPAATTTMWPEYGRLLPARNALASEGYAIEEGRGPETDEHGAVAVGRTLMAHGPALDASAIRARFDFAFPIEVSDIGDDRVGHEPSWGAHMMDGWTEDWSPYDVDLTVVPTTSRRRIPARSWSFAVQAVPLQDALRSARPLRQNDVDGRLTVPAEQPRQGSWGRLIDVIAHLTSRGATASASLGPYHELSPAVLIAVGAIISMSADPATELEQLDLPPGAFWERLDSGDAVLRDFGPEGYRPSRPNFALVVRRERTS